jgi:hypothetical protein
MTPYNFPQANTYLTASNNYDESQVATIPAYVGKLDRGCLDGSNMIVVAWLPDKDELADLNKGKPVYLCFLGDGLLAHYLTTNPTFK